MMLNKEEFEEGLKTIYFSKNRPMQLALTLETGRKHSKEWKYQNNTIIYKATNERFEEAYSKLIEEYSDIKFIKEESFKKDLLKIFDDNFSYVLFVVDDTIFTDDFSLVSICHELENFPSSLGFSLRLGRNTTYCYPLYIQNEIPYFHEAMNYKFSRFNWQKVKSGDFSYPLELSSSVYRVKDIYPLLSDLFYETPNSLEWVMSCNLSLFKDKPDLLCFKKSVAFSNPINRIQTENTNRVGTKPDYTIDALLEKFEKGYRIKNNFDGFTPNGCHQEVNVEFI